MHQKISITIEKVRDRELLISSWRSVLYKEDSYPYSSLSAEKEETDSKKNKHLFIFSRIALKKHPLFALQCDMSSPARRQHKQREWESGNGHIDD